MCPSVYFTFSDLIHVLSAVRFDKKHLTKLHEALHLPDRIVLDNRATVDSLEALVITLHRLRCVFVKIALFIFQHVLYVIICYLAN